MLSQPSSPGWIYELSPSTVPPNDQQCCCLSVMPGPHQIPGGIRNPLPCACSHPDPAVCSLIVKSEFGCVLGRYTPSVTSAVLSVVLFCFGLVIFALTFSLLVNVNTEHSRNVLVCASFYLFGTGFWFL